jgi:hypothetical protein
MSTCPCCQQTIEPKGESLEALTERVLHRVVNLHNVPVELIKSTRMFAPVVKARRDAWYELVIVEGLSLPTASYVTSGKWHNFHHTSVLYGVRSYAAKTVGTPPKASLNQIRAAHRSFHGEMAA